MQALLKALIDGIAYDIGSPIRGAGAARRL